MTRRLWPASVLCLVVTWGCGGRPLRGSVGGADARQAMDGASDRAERDASAATEARDAVSLERDADARVTSDTNGAAPDVADARFSPDLGDARTRDVLAETALASDALGVDARVVQPGKPRALTRILTGGPWKTSQGVKGFAVDPQKRLYLEDDHDVYMIDGQTVTTYLTFAEATAAAAPRVLEKILDMDLGPDGALYLLVSVWPSTTPKPAVIMRSTAPHTADMWLDVSGLSHPTRLSAFSAGSVGVMHDGGLTMFPAAGPVIFSAQAVQRFQSDCGWEVLTGSPSGAYLYSPGCLSTSLYSGNVGGPGPVLLYDRAAFMQPTSIYALFECTGREPSGAFLFVVDQTSHSVDADTIYRTSQDATGANVLEPIATTPTFFEAAEAQNETFAFGFCSLAVAGDGTIFFLTQSQLWKVEPAQP
jgi:hypothetical protein